MAEELKACAHCGGEAGPFFHCDRGFGESWHVECLADDCGVGTGHFDTRDQAIAAWNTRTGAPS